MFTGIIKEVAQIKRIKKQQGKISFHLNLSFQTGEGDSVSVNGVCLTVSKNIGQVSIFTAVPETLSRTNLTDLKPGNYVNIEPSLKLEDKLGGHLVYGHIDGTGKIKDIKRTSESVEFAIEYPPELAKYIAEKGSIALDGISLTISGVKDNVLRVSIIPHTYKNTNLHFRQRGDRVNIEVDPVARYLQKIMEEQ